MQAKYLDPGILGSIGSLDLVARQVVEGVRIGMHRSPARGISSDPGTPGGGDHRVLCLGTSPVSTVTGMGHGVP